MLLRGVHGSVDDGFDAAWADSRAQVGELVCLCLLARLPILFFDLLLVGSVGLDLVKLIFSLL